ncbi:MAG: hypothetical protein CFK52_01175 [Chloracidobacterium sp. CP2_5A]|nr:MAG: hypothetical protein CFK52_01175 [Chloracidobacterium sp. CP2_5A]
MTSLAALGVRVYVTEWGDVRIETLRWRQTLPPEEFARRLQAALPPGEPPRPSALSRPARAGVPLSGWSAFTS